MYKDKKVDMLISEKINALSGMQKRAVFGFAASVGKGLLKSAPKISKGLMSYVPKSFGIGGAMTAFDAAYDANAAKNLVTGKTFKKTMKINKLKPL